MRFECSVALKYLFPKRRQLSASIISLVSVIVISLVVWLVIVFLSVTDGMEKKWKGELIAINAPLRLAPTEAYYHSYYYLIDTISYASGYTTKTIGEKLKSDNANPFDPNYDMEMPSEFPPPDLTSDGQVKDLVRECWAAIDTLGKKYPDIRSREYEVAFGNLRLNLFRPDKEKGEIEETCLTQLSYVASYDNENTRFQSLVMPPSVEDLSNFLKILEAHEKNRELLPSFLADAGISHVCTPLEGYILPTTLFPQEGTLSGYGIVDRGVITKVYVSESKNMDLPHAVKGQLVFRDKKPAAFLPDSEFDSMSLSSSPFIVLGRGFEFEASHIPNTTQYQISGKIKDMLIEGKIGIDELKHLEIAEAHPKFDFDSPAENPPLWVYREQTNQKQYCCQIPAQKKLGDGVLIPKSFKNNGVRLGDRGFLAYYTGSSTTSQEQRLPIYVAGFYDPGLLPIGNKLILVGSDVVALLRGNLQVADKMLGNGIQLWFNKIDNIESMKADLIAELKTRGIDSYWSVESYLDYDFAKPILQQLQSDKTLFTLIALIILAVACSNIISMLILLVNDKKREIGILQSMGATPTKIASIFGLCGCVTGIVSSVLGTLAALLTLHYLQSLVNFLSFVQGHDAFQSAFYGSRLPNELSMTAFLFALSATMAISILAGIVPALKASKIRPSEILRSE